MLARILADLVFLAHLGFVLFAVLGGLLVLRRRRIAWLHVPALVWAVAVSLLGWICPLTPLENALRRAAGEAGYAGGFVDRYLVPIVYPEELTRVVQVGLGLALLAFNAAVYLRLIRRARRARAPRASAPPPPRPSAPGA